MFVPCECLVEARQSVTLLRVIGRCRSLRGAVWTQLQDIHEALGLRYQWGGSHCNKALLCCLGIDTRNIVSVRGGDVESRQGHEDNLLIVTGVFLEVI